MMRKRRFIQGLLILALLCGAVLLAHPAAAWAAPDGDGSAASPYQIADADDLYWFAEQVNDGAVDACAELMGDIVLNEGLDQTKFAVDNNGTLTYGGSQDISFDQWTPIGNSSNSYEGTFNGNNNTISGLYINDSTIQYSGIFGCIGSNGKVSDLALTNSFIRGCSSRGNHTGGICGYNNGGSITGCSNSGFLNVNITAAYIQNYVGGICGMNDGTIEECSNSGGIVNRISMSGTTDASIRAGGICGKNTNTIMNCDNSGTIRGTGNNINAGGICGWNDGNVSGCSNISISSIDVKGSNADAGGICGYNTGGTKECSNSGSISASGFNSSSGKNCDAGGICGYSSGENASIGSCMNSGKVTGSGSAGGVCGTNLNSIKDCDNKGNVNGSDANNSIGGICGVNSGSWNYGGTISNCSNSGTVTGNGTTQSYAGGICGTNNYNYNISNCSNSGPVTGSSRYISGICAWNSGSISNCSNSALVSSTGTNSDVGSICWGNYGTIKHCYWLKTTDDGAGIGTGTGTNEDVESKTVDQYASGEVAWLLNQNQADDPWRQNLNEPDKDEIPTLDATHRTVVQLVFNENPGSGANTTRYANAGADLPSVKEPVREGYIFAGWSTEQNGSGSSSLTATPDEDTILYAQWLEVTLNPTNFTYNGQPLEPDPIVKIGDQMLTKDTDYTVAYDNNVNAGTATITVTGIGSYTGISGSITFIIDPATLTIASADVADKTYDGSTAATVNSVTFSEVTNSDMLQLGSDYMATAVFDSADAGQKTATVTVKVINSNYTLAEDATTCQATATIAKADYDGAVAASGTIQPGKSSTVSLPMKPEGASYGTPTTTDSAAVRSLSIIDNQLNYSGGSISDGAGLHCDGAGDRRDEFQRLHHHCHVDW
ncbi:MAG: InlB B-repeat-containing protein [Peptococcaceae bacterium]|nr:InlB B-repeat-containing protein [Peptococcaceae bacterium]